MNRLDRLTAILTQLQSKRTIRAQEIADRFDISLRTVYRDVRALEEAGVPVIGEAGMGYSLVEGYRLPPVMFTKEEATALLVAEKIFEKIADKTSGQHFNTAMTKIRSVLKNSEKDTLENISPLIGVFRNRNMLHQKGKDHLLQSIIESLGKNALIQIEYTTFEKEEKTSRILEPVGIYHAYQQWYLIAWCRLRKDYRTFRLDRVNSLNILSETFEPIHPSLNAYLAKVAKQENLIKVVIEVPNSDVKYLKEQRYDHGFVFEKSIGDFVEMTFMTSSIEHFVRWIIMISDFVTVIEPEEIKVRLRDLLNQILERIGKENSNTI
jgi:predicted DNA-binding transcriptional regulator YafY